MVSPKSTFLETFNITNNGPEDYIGGFGIIYSLEVTALSSSSTNHRRFLSALFLHCAVPLWDPLGDRHGSIMMHRGHRGWGGLTSSSMTTVSQTCWFQNCTRMAVWVSARPLHPSTGQGIGPITLLISNQPK